jgi:gliding motility-associated protein GldL
MAQSRTYKKAMNFVYGMGAAVVIIGALFKIQHISLDLGVFQISGGVMLTIGLIVEAFVFAISAFDTPEDELDWSKVYPELGDDGVKSEKELGTQGLLSQKLDNLLQEANIDAGLMESLGSSMKNFQGAAEGLSAASESISSTNKYNEQVSMAAVQMETLNTLYKAQV